MRQRKKNEIQARLEFILRDRFVDLDIKLPWNNISNTLSFQLWLSLRTIREF